VKKTKRPYNIPYTDSVTSKLRIGLIATAVLVVAAIAVASPQRKDYAKIRKLLGTYNVLDSPSALRKAFNIGDGDISDFVLALDDPDERVRLNAQIIIRYLGNPEGMKKVIESSRTGHTHDFSGPVPIPLDDWDFQQIEMHVLCSDCVQGGPYANYFYALEIDDSMRARKTLARVPSTTLLIAGLPELGSYELLCPRECDLERTLSQHAFFLSADDKKHLSVVLVSQSEDGNKALLKVHVNAGPVTEKWFHVVVVRRAEGWKYMSVSLIGQS
jgi:hypothetical protein